MPILNFIATEPNRLAMVPFAVLLLAIALGPLIARHHWERHYHKLCLALAGIVCFYYLLVVVRSSLSPEASICGRKHRVVRSETRSSFLPAPCSGA